MIAMLLLMLWLGAECAPGAFFIGVALAFVLDPLVTFLQRRGVPRWGGVLILYAVVVALIWPPRHVRDPARSPRRPTT